jgi:hypothetical protein
MTTVIRERTEWDAFLLENVEREYPNATQRETELESRLKQVEGFREQEWQSIRGQLKRDYHWVVLVEPHWTTSGSAIFWQRQTVREAGRDADGKPAIIEVEKGWDPAGPFPANNASQIAYHLGKGLLLRHPDEGPCVERSETAEPSEAVQDKPDHKFQCDRHRGNWYGFPTWKAYRQHCLHFQEAIDSTQVPLEVLDDIKKYHWYCLEHNGGWPLKAHRGALQHLSKHPLWELANLEVTNADTIGTEPENSSTQEVVSSYLNEQFRSNK